MPPQNLQKVTMIRRGFHSREATPAVQHHYRPRQEALFESQTDYQLDCICTFVVTKCLTHPFLIDFMFIATLILVRFWGEPLPPLRLTVYVPYHQLCNMYECGSKYPKYKEERVTRKMKIVQCRQPSGGETSFSRQSNQLSVVRGELLQIFYSTRNCG